MHLIINKDNDTNVVCVCNQSIVLLMYKVNRVLKKTVLFSLVFRSRYWQKYLTEFRNNCRAHVPNVNTMFLPFMGTNYLDFMQVLLLTIMIQHSVLKTFYCQLLFFSFLENIFHQYLLFILSLKFFYLQVFVYFIYSRIRIMSTCISISKLQ